MYNLSKLNNRDLPRKVFIVPFAQDCFTLVFVYTPSFILPLAPKKEEKTVHPKQTIFYNSN
jgi:hypothetical protein